MLSKKENYHLVYIVKKLALAGVAQWIERRPPNRKVTCLSPHQGTSLGRRPGPQLGAWESNQLMYLLNINVSLLLFLKINK